MTNFKIIVMQQQITNIVLLSGELNLKQSFGVNDGIKDLRENIKFGLMVLYK